MSVLSEKFIRLIKDTLIGMVEKQRRLYLGSIALALGFGGITALSKALHVSRGCIQRGVAEVKAGEVYHPGDRSRAFGGGRKSIEEKHRIKILSMGCFSETEIQEVVDIMKVIEKVVQNSSYGNPMANQAWINVTVKSVADEITQLTGLSYSHSSIKKLIRKLGYSLQKNQKYDQVGESHPLRDAQFIHIKARREEYEATGDPVISIDTKAKEKLGDFIRPGSEYRKIKDPRRVLDHDFAFSYAQIYRDADINPVPENLQNKNAVISPYGIYCTNNNTGYTVIGVDNDTSEFAADSITLWWENQGRKQFPNARRMLILADGGGSNRSRGWIWKIALQQLSDRLGIPIEMCHYPPGTSKYNPIERRLWSQVSHAWTAKPLKTLEIVREYTRHTSTKTGLIVECEINYKTYFTESDKKKAMADNRDFEGIINSALYQTNILIQYIGDCTELQKWNYAITPHDNDKRWKNYRMVS